MAQVFEQHIQAQDVHFAKIDVEGFESDVLAGFDWQRNRPWIIVVEAIRPGGTEGTWSQWEPQILQEGYEMVWFDGLNRFYLREESADLREHFRIPVNLFDQFQIPWIRNNISLMEMRLLSLWG